MDDWKVDAWKLSSDVSVAIELWSDETVAPSEHGELLVHGATLVWNCTVRQVGEEDKCG